MSLRCLRLASMGAAVVLGAVLAVGCASTGPRSSADPMGPRPGFSRALSDSIFVLQTLHAPGLGEGLPEPSAVSEELYLQLVVDVARIIGPSMAPVSLSNRRQRQAVLPLARGERTVPGDYDGVRETLSSRYALFSWVDERVVRGAESVRSDLEPTDIRAGEGLARHVAVEGTLAVELVDLETGEALWSGRRDYSTPRAFSPGVDREALDRARGVAATQLALALEADWRAASD